MTTKDALIGPMEVRFTEPADVEKYGADWYTYDELAIVTRPARELVALEMELGVPLASVLDGFRASTVLGDLAAAWLAYRAAGNALPFAEFNPAIMLAEWRKVDLGKEPSSPPVSDTPAPDVVRLPTSPPAESQP